MGANISRIVDDLKRSPKVWLITGVAGFIGSNLLEFLLINNQKVVGLDNFSTGKKRNLEEVRDLLENGAWSNFKFIEGDIRDLSVCKAACTGVNYVLHQAALGSVPRSINDPISTNAVNIDGFLNVLLAAKQEGVAGFVYAASSSTYGDHPDLPKREEVIGNPLSPYAVTKYVNELYASVFSKVYGFNSVGLRYFNVFGKRQDPNGAYAAVIPRWVAAMLKNESVFINGDGETSRDFCYVDNVVQANILAATNVKYFSKEHVFNVAYGERNSLKQLFELIKNELQSGGINYQSAIVYQDFRPGDVRHSLASIEKARTTLGYFPRYSLSDGIKLAVPWYVKFFESDGNEAR